MTTAQETRAAFVQGLIDAGEKGIAGGDQAWLDAYFAPEFAFHGPDGAELDYAGLLDYWAALRAAFDDLTIARGIMVAEGDYIACQTTISGTFAREWMQSPVGSLAPNGQRVDMELLNIFRYDDQGRLVEEWLQTDQRSLLRQLGAEGR